MVDVSTLYKINDGVTALANEHGVAFASEEIEDAVYDELTHAIAVEWGIEEESDAPAMTAARGAVPDGNPVDEARDSIFDSLNLLARLYAPAGDYTAACEELTDLVMRRFGYPINP